MTILQGGPRIRLVGDVLTLTASDGLGAVLHETSPIATPAAPPTTPLPTTSAPTTTPTISPDRVPTLEELRGHVFIAQGPVASVMLRFGTDGTIAASYGCNGGQIVATIDDGHLVLSEWERTAKGCTGGLTEQDDAVVGMLTSAPAIAFINGRLRLSSPSLTLTFDEQRPAQLVGTRWVTNGRITGPVTGFSGLQSELRLNSDRTWTFAGCTASIGGRYSVNGTQLTFTFESPTPPSSCANATQADEVAALITLLQSPATFTITEQTLRLMGSDGNGELFIARG